MGDRPLATAYLIPVAIIIATAFSSYGLRLALEETEDHERLESGLIIRFLVARLK